MKSITEAMTECQNLDGQAIVFCTLHSERYVIAKSIVKLLTDTDYLCGENPYINRINEMLPEDTILLPVVAEALLSKVWDNPGGRGRREKPTINDELSYTGAGDRHSEGDTIESHLGAFLGGGSGTTGEKPASKQGQYFRGRFDPGEHKAADNLKWLRETIDSSIAFWKMAPDRRIFSNLDADFRGMSWPGREYVLGTNKAHRGIVAQLPPGTWKVACHDVVKKESKVLSAEARGRFTFDAPDSRAVLFHFKALGKR